jgi:hypothetical protein
MMPEIFQKCQEPRAKAIKRVAFYAHEIFDFVEPAVLEHAQKTPFYSELKRGDCKWRFLTLQNQ